MSTKKIAKKSNNRCVICGKTFSRKDSLDRHTQNSTCIQIIQHKIPLRRKDDEPLKYVGINLENPNHYVDLLKPIDFKMSITKDVTTAELLNLYGVLNNIHVDKGYADPFLGLHQNNENGSNPYATLNGSS